MNGCKLYNNIISKYLTNWKWLSWKPTSFQTLNESDSACTGSLPISLLALQALQWSIVQEPHACKWGTSMKKYVNCQHLPLWKNMWIANILPRGRSVGTQAQVLKKTVWLFNSYAVCVYIVLHKLTLCGAWVTVSPPFQVIQYLTKKNLKTTVAKPWHHAFCHFVLAAGPIGGFGAPNCESFSARDIILSPSTRQRAQKITVIFSHLRLKVQQRSCLRKEKGSSLKAASECDCMWLHVVLIRLSPRSVHSCSCFWDPMDQPLNKQQTPRSSMVTSSPPRSTIPDQYPPMPWQWST